MCKNRYVKWKKSVCSCKFTHTMTWANMSENKRKQTNGKTLKTFGKLVFFIV